MDEGTRILMVVKEAEARAAYEEVLQKVGVAYDVAPSFNDLLRMSINNSYSGLLIDLLTLMRSSREEKNIAYDCINFYPSVRVKWDARNKTMNLSPLEQAPHDGGAATLAYFIENRCKSFKPRSLRRFNRKDSFLSLLLVSDHGPLDPGVKTFTVNISQGGAFVHTTAPFQKNDPVSLRFADLPDEPIRACVCWRIEWGTCRSIPGIGLMFSELSEQRAGVIKRLADL